MPTNLGPDFGPGLEIRDGLDPGGRFLDLEGYGLGNITVKWVNNGSFQVQRVQLGMN